MSEEELEDLKWQQTEYEENIIGELVKENEQLKSQLQQKENIIKEIREKIEDEIERATNSIYIELDEDTYIKMFKEYLQILDKGETK